MVTQRHPSSNTTHSRGNWSTDDHTYTQPLAGVDTGTSRPNPRRPGTFLNSSTRPGWQRNSPARELQVTFRRNDLRRLNLSSIDTKLTYFLISFYSSELSRKITSRDRLRSLQSFGGPRQPGARDLSWLKRGEVGATNANSVVKW